MYFRDFRNWIDEQCSKFVQREKEEEKVIAEKEKVFIRLATTLALYALYPVLVSSE